MPPRKRVRRKLAAAEAEKKDWELGMEGAAGGEERTEASSPTLIPETQSLQPETQEAETQEAETQEAERLEAERLEAMIMEAEPEDEEAQEDTDILLSQKGKSKRGKLRSILFTEADEEAIVNFLKDHEWLYDKRDPLYKDTQKKDVLWAEFSATRNLNPEDVKKWVQSQRTMYGKLTLSRSGQGPAELTERQQWVANTFSFLKSHIIRHTSKKAGFKPVAAAATSSPKARGSQSDTETVDISHSRIGSDLESSVLASSPVLSRRVSRTSVTPTDETLSREIGERLVRMEDSIEGFLKEVTKSKMDSPRGAYLNWLSVETEKLGDEEFQQFKMDSFNLVMRVQNQARAWCERLWCVQLAVASVMWWGQAHPYRTRPEPDNSR